MKPRFLAARCLAAILAAGGLFWSSLLWLAYGGDPGPEAILFLAPGYLVTLGYILRTAMLPTCGARTLIWGLSLLVQGGFLVLQVTDTWSQETLLHVFNPAGIWWLLATTASIAGLLLDWEPHSLNVTATED